MPKILRSDAVYFCRKCCGHGVPSILTVFVPSSFAEIEEEGTKTVKSDRRRIHAAGLPASSLQTVPSDRSSARILSSILKCRGSVGLIFRGGGGMILNGCTKWWMRSVPAMSIIPRGSGICLSTTSSSSTHSTEAITRGRERPSFVNQVACQS